MGQIWAKYRKMSVQAKSAIWFTMCSILQKGISFIMVPIFTRLMSTTEYGTYSLYLSWLQILTIVTSLYLYQGVFNNGMTKFSEDRDTYISVMQGLTLTVTTGVFAIYLIAHNWWSALLGLAPILMLLMFIEMMVTPALYFWSGRQRFEFQYKRLVVVTLGKSVANPVLGLIMVFLAEEKATARIASVALTEILFCGVLMIRQYMKGRRFIHLAYWNYALRLAIPLLPHYLSGMILNQGDRIMIDRMVGKSEVAFYSVAYSIGMLVQIFTHAINNSFTPWMYQKIKSGNYTGVKKTINFLLIIVAVISFGLMMFSPELVQIFGSESYANAVYVIPPVSASVFFIFLYNILAIPQFYFEKTKFLAVSSFAAAAINVILNFIFIKLYGFAAAGYTTLTCYVLYSFGHFLVSRKVMKEFLTGIELYDKRFILGLSGIMIAIGILCNFVFHLWYIRYIIILVIGLTAYLKKKKIIELIKGIRKK